MCRWQRSGYVAVEVPGHPSPWMRHWEWLSLVTRRPSRYTEHWGSLFFPKYLSEYSVLQFVRGKLSRHRRKPQPSALFTVGHGCLNVVTVANGGFVIANPSIKLTHVQFILLRNRSAHRTCNCTHAICRDCMLSLCSEYCNESVLSRACHAMEKGQENMIWTCVWNPRFIPIKSNGYW